MNERASGASSRLLGWTVRSIMLHVATYIVIGGLSIWLVASRYWTGPEALPWLRDPESAFVQRWFFPAQILRGALYAIALFPLRDALLDMRRSGGAVIATLLLVIGAIAGISGDIEGWLYSTTFHLGLFMAHLPEIVVQTLAYGYLLLAWERRGDRKRSGRVVITPAPLV